ncbi:MAG: bifunctional 5,10-methylenetetrahydrofolate dehydrogenase/5,10-methenyltetrahydrofolate cyclohydrolase [Gammaproteobacteria bacterium]|nr:bifunctional 5,10-methylenetetrahydrofolate dehydrogenase/5,10-methenyltetrahydrofolate cyclohydrolase [Gammaproteobacteria bacterium]MBT8125339.1 bifunctional 5,10-methylenetetrahydrofolate dehydrogenase/5,10-methenyltetrahydrofolate cyclohydrolase [Gammaproteobacteria bacterium]NNC68109.1 bifunctional 5,10-methylenetetrahydrofolate dehydrogenase/5,10-methenyltetrahydrofolate cyclohydrolase [Gammaproteobacteria bacterium]
MTTAFEKTPGGAILMNGNVVAEKIQTNIASTLSKNPNANLTLATVLIGNDPASKLYVGMKEKRAAAIGIHSKHVELAGDISMQQACEEITKLANDPNIHGILIQLPLPTQVDTHRIIDLLPPEKDVDGLSENNLGKLMRGEPGLVPCTPLGVMRILEHYEISTSGKHAVVIGRSTLVGLPQVLLLGRKGTDATVTLAHSRSGDIGEYTKSADIVVAAAGIAHLIKQEHIKPGAAVIDVGVTRTDAGIRGDVDFDAVQNVAGAITPMPGGTGPMTVACLLENTLYAAKLQNAI